MDDEVKRLAQQRKIRIKAIMAERKTEFESLKRKSLAVRPSNLGPGNLPAHARFPGANRLSENSGRSREPGSDPASYASSGGEAAFGAPVSSGSGGAPGSSGSRGPGSAGPVTLNIDSLLDGNPLSERRSFHPGMMSDNGSKKSSDDLGSPRKESGTSKIKFQAEAGYRSFKRMSTGSLENPQEKIKPGESAKENLQMSGQGNRQGKAAKVTVNSQGDMVVDRGISIKVGTEMIHSNKSTKATVNNQGDMVVDRGIVDGTISSSDRNATESGSNDRSATGSSSKSAARPLGILAKNKNSNGDLAELGKSAESLSRVAKKGSDRKATTAAADADQVADRAAVANKQRPGQPGDRQDAGNQMPRGANQVSNGATRSVDQRLSSSKSNSRPGSLSGSRQGSSNNLFGSYTNNRKLINGSPVNGSEYYYQPPALPNGRSEPTFRDSVTTLNMGQISMTLHSERVGVANSKSLGSMRVSSNLKRPVSGGADYQQQSDQTRALEEHHNNLIGPIDFVKKSLNNLKLLRGQQSSSAVGGQQPISFDPMASMSSLQDVAALRDVANLRPSQSIRAGSAESQMPFRQRSLEVSGSRSAADFSIPREASTKERTLVDRSYDRSGSQATLRNSLHGSLGGLSTGSREFKDTASLAARDFDNAPPKKSVPSHVGGVIGLEEILQSFTLKAADRNPSRKSSNERSEQWNNLGPLTELGTPLLSDSEHSALFPASGATTDGNTPSLAGVKPDIGSDASSDDEIDEWYLTASSNWRSRLVFLAEEVFYGTVTLHFVVWWLIGTAVFFFVENHLLTDGVFDGKFKDLFGTGFTNQGSSTTLENLGFSVKENGADYDKRFEILEDTTTSLSLIDAAYVSMSILSQAGLVSVDWTQFSVVSHCFSLWLMICGALPLLVCVPPSLRRYNFRCQHAIWLEGRFKKNKRKAARAAKAIEAEKTRRLEARETTLKSKALGYSGTTLLSDTHEEFGSSISTGGIHSRGEDYQVSTRGKVYQTSTALVHDDMDDDYEEMGLLRKDSEVLLRSEYLEMDEDEEFDFQCEVERVLEYKALGKLVGFILSYYVLVQLTGWALTVGYIYLGTDVMSPHARTAAEEQSHDLAKYHHKQNTTSIDAGNMAERMFADMEDEMRSMIGPSGITMSSGGIVPGISGNSTSTMGNSGMFFAKNNTTAPNTDNMNVAISGTGLNVSSRIVESIAESIAEQSAKRLARTDTDGVEFYDVDGSAHVFLRSIAHDRILWKTFYLCFSCFHNNGLTLWPNSVGSFQNETFLLYVMAVLILMGNTFFPVFLRLGLHMMRLYYKHFPEDYGMSSEIDEFNLHDAEEIAEKYSVENSRLDDPRAFFAAQGDFEYLFIHGDRENILRGKNESGTDKDSSEIEPPASIDSRASIDLGDGKDIAPRPSKESNSSSRRSSYVLGASSSSDRKADKESAEELVAREEMKEAFRINRQLKLLSLQEKWSNYRAYDFLLRHPRRCCTHLFPVPHTQWLCLLGCILNIIQWVCYYSQDWSGPGFNHLIFDTKTGTIIIAAMSVQLKFANSFFQGASTRTAGLSSIDPALFSLPTSWMICILMYAATSPTVVVMRFSALIPGQDRVPEMDEQRESGVLSDIEEGDEGPEEDDRDRLEDLEEGIEGEELEGLERSEGGNIEVHPSAHRQSGGAAVQKAFNIYSSHASHDHHHVHHHVQHHAHSVPDNQQSLLGPVEKAAEVIARWNPFNFGPKTDHDHGRNETSTPSTDHGRKSTNHRGSTFNAGSRACASARGSPLNAKNARGSLGGRYPGSATAKKMFKRAGTVDVVPSSADKRARGSSPLSGSPFSASSLSGAGKRALYKKRSPSVDQIVLSNDDIPGLQDSETLAVPFRKVKSGRDAVAQAVFIDIPYAEVSAGAKSLERDPRESEPRYDTQESAPSPNRRDSHPVSEILDDGFHHSNNSFGFTGQADTTVTHNTMSGVSNNQGSINTSKNEKVKSPKLLGFDSSTDRTDPIGDQDENRTSVSMNESRGSISMTSMRKSVAMRATMGRKSFMMNEGQLLEAAKLLEAANQAEGEEAEELRMKAGEQFRIISAASREDINEEDELIGVDITGVPEGQEGFGSSADASQPNSVKHHLRNYFVQHTVFLIVSVWFVLLFETAFHAKAGFAPKEDLSDPTYVNKRMRPKVEEELGLPENVNDTMSKIVIGRTTTKSSNSTMGDSESTHVNLPYVVSNQITYDTYPNSAEVKYPTPNQSSSTHPYQWSSTFNGDWYHHDGRDGTIMLELAQGLIVPRVNELSDASAPRLLVLSGNQVSDGSVPKQHNLRNIEANHRSTVLETIIDPRADSEEAASSPRYQSYIPVEKASGPGVPFLKLVYEIASAFGTCGLSLGGGYTRVDATVKDKKTGKTEVREGYVPNGSSYSGCWSWASKLLLIAIMLQGKLRGLPDSIDPSVALTMK